jgi:hypothetical protein
MQKKGIKIEMALVDDIKKLKDGTLAFIRDAEGRLNGLKVRSSQIETLKKDIQADNDKATKLIGEFQTKIQSNYTKIYNQALNISKTLGIPVLQNKDFLEADKAIGQGNRMVDLLNGVQSNLKKGGLVK